MREIVIPADMAALSEEILNLIYNSEVEIRQILVEEGNPCFSSYNGVLYNKDMTELLCYPRGKQSKSYHIPETVSRIAPMAFTDGRHYPAKLEEVFLPSLVTEIPDYCFNNMGIYSVCLPEGIESIGEYAFADTNLVCPTLPSSLIHLATTAFHGCKRMHMLNIKEDNFGLKNSMLPEEDEIHVIIETTDAIDHSKYPGVSVMNLMEMDKWLMEI